MVDMTTVIKRTKSGKGAMIFVDESPEEKKARQLRRQQKVADAAASQLTKEQLDSLLASRTPQPSS